MPTTLPEDDLVAHLLDRASEGTFEAHLTVDAPTLPERDRFRAVCADLGVKCVLIELPVGVTRSQPMTSTYHRGQLGEVVLAVAALARALRSSGFTPTRVKLEAVITNAGLPITDAEASAFPASNYFEFHVKAMLPNEADLDRLRGVCARHRAHLSANALKREQDGRSERFITQRLYGVGRRTAEAAFESLLVDLADAGFELANRLREYAIYDSNIAVDAGWIDAPGDEDHAHDH